MTKYEIKDGMVLYTCHVCGKKKRIDLDWLITKKIKLKEDLCEIEHTEPFNYWMVKGR